MITFAGEVWMVLGGVGAAAVAVLVLTVLGTIRNHIEHHANSVEIAKLRVIRQQQLEAHEHHAGRY